MRIIKDVISQTDDIDVIDDSGYTAMHRAVLQKQFEIVEYLIQQGASVKADKGRLHLNILQDAVDGGDFLIAKILLENGADVLRGNISTLVVTAVREGDEEFLKLLLKKGININSVDIEGYSALHRAAITGRVDLVKHLIERGATVEVGIKGKSILHDAVQIGNLLAVKYIVPGVADINHKDTEHNTPLRKAVSNGKGEIAKYLLELGALNDQADVKIAVSKGYFDIATLLFETKINVSHYVLNRFLKKAIKKGDAEFTQLLLKKGANINFSTKGYVTPLYIAVKQKNVAMQQLLINNGANVNVAKSVRWTLIPLLLASFRKDIDTVKMLIESGAHLNSTGINGETALHVASSFEVVKYLVERGADVNALDKSGWTPLISAAASSARDNFKIIQILVDNRADINIKTNKYKNGVAGESTALHIATAYDFMTGVKIYFEIIQFLLIKGADKNIKNSYGRSPLDIAMGYDPDSEVTKYISNHKQKVTDPPNKLQRNRRFVNEISLINNPSTEPLLQLTTEQNNIQRIPELNQTLLNNSIILGTLLFNKTKRDLPMPDILLPPREQSMWDNNVDANNILKIIQEAREKYGSTDDEEN